MSTIQLTLNDAQDATIQEISRTTGKSPETLLCEGLELLAERERLDLRRARFKQAFGMWKDRDDLPDFEAMKQELNRPWADRVDP